MSKRPAKADAPPALNIPERLLLFCVASGTDWEHSGITGAHVTSIVVKGLIAREPTGGLYLTKEGRLRFGRWWESTCDGALSLRHVFPGVPHIGTLLGHTH